MPSMLQKSDRSSNTYNFRYKRIKKTGPAAPDPPQYCKKLEWATITVDGQEKKVVYQDRYTCRRGVFPGVQAGGGLTKAGQVHKRPANKIFRCLRCGVKGGPEHCGRNCTIANFFETDDVHASLELRETRNMGIGVFTTAPLPADSVIGLYTGELKRREHLRDHQVPYVVEPDSWAADGEGRKTQIDASERGNWTRFVNHHCKPNCKFVGALACGKVLVWYVRTRTAIPADTELFVDYGRSYFREGGRKGGRFINGGCLCGWWNCHSSKKPPRKRRGAAQG